MIDKYIEKLQKKYSNKKKIIVAMSGGVDSSVTATLINKAGFETIGVTLQLYKSDVQLKSKSCCSGLDIKDAQTVAIQENFKHYILDYTNNFKEKVINNFIDCYEKGETPNPCARCNQYIKFGYLLDFCKKIQGDLLVTGHYAKKINNQLYRGQDRSKDQSYFLALTTKEQLKMIDFPLSNINKSIVREIAETFKLNTAKKAESMDICFIPEGNYKDFLRKLRPEMFKEGLIFSLDNKILGKHNGLASYTIGQRKNLNLDNGPWYVKKIDVTSNQLIVCKKEDLYQQCFLVQEVNLLVDDKFFEEEIQIQIRSRHIPACGKFDLQNNKVIFNSPQEAICKGQICAFYSNNHLLGGCVIKEPL